MTDTAETILVVTETYRRRWDMIRARTRLELQAQAICRRFCQGDKTEATKLWGRILKGDEKVVHHATAVEPFVAAMEPLNVAQAAVEKVLRREAKKLPCYDWVQTISGFGDVSFASVVAELAGGDESNPRTIADYKSRAAVWKRMGVGLVQAGDYIVEDLTKASGTRQVHVENTERQRRIAGDGAYVHGYAPGRRAVMWNIGACIIKAQVRKDADDEEKRIGIGPLGALYLSRKEHEATKVESKAHAHNRAQRYIEKQLLADLRREWKARI